MLLLVDMSMYTYVGWVRKIVIILEGEMYEMCTSGLFMKNWKHSKWAEDVDMMLPKETCEEVTSHQSIIHFPLCKRLKTIWQDFRETSSTSIRAISNGLSIWEGACKRKGLTNWEGVITQLGHYSYSTSNSSKLRKIREDQELWRHPQKETALLQHCIHLCYVLVRNHCNQFTYISSWREIVRNEAGRYLRELELDN